MNIRGKSSKELKEIIGALSVEKKELLARISKLENKSRQETGVKIITKQKTKTESFSEFRKLSLAKSYAKQYIDDKIKSSFDTKISDLSKVSLLIADFCTENTIPLRQLGILLYASNFRFVRKKDLYVGRDTGDWYAQTIEAMLKKELIMRVNPDMKKWIYFSLTPNGERIVRDIRNKLKGYLVQDDKEAGGIERSATRPKA